jgi:hypothetical protein
VTSNRRPGARSARRGQADEPPARRHPRHPVRSLVRCVPCLCHVQLRPAPDRDVDGGWRARGAAPTPSGPASVATGVRKVRRPRLPCTRKLVAASFSSGAGLVGTLSWPPACLRATRTPVCAPGAVSPSHGPSSIAGRRCATGSRPGARHAPSPERSNGEPITRSGSTRAAARLGPPTPPRSMPADESGTRPGRKVHSPMAPYPHR